MARFVFRRCASGLRIMVAALLPTALAAAAPAGAENPWVGMARTDIAGIHDVLRDNHPGSVDPENRNFASWLEGGRAAALTRARDARSYADYRRALLYYVNGFRDGHVALDFQASATRLEWPGFVVQAQEPGKIVVAVSADARPPKGAQLVSCDGKDVDALLRERTDPYWWNADLPHTRESLAVRLFYSDADDISRRFSQCTFRVDGSSRIERLTYQAIDTAALQAQIRSASTPPPEMGIRQIDGLWFVSIPNFWDDSKVKLLLADLEVKAPILRTAKVVLDMRGNGGGNSAWGERAARILWGDAYAAHYIGLLDSTLDARVSTANIAHVRMLAARYPSQGDLGPMADRMEAALRERRPYVRIDNPPTTGGAAPPTPVTGKVYLLTDDRCYSACLNFLDIVRPMPGVVHVGLPTGADAVYIDNVPQPLPSRLARLSYGYKVFRHRVRGNNQWYDPAIRWPGGPMTDAAVAGWIATLAR